MDTATGLIAVVLDDGKSTPDDLARAVTYARSAPEIVRAVVATTRDAAIASAVSPATTYAATPAELASDLPFDLFERIASWRDAKDGEPVRLVMALRPSNLPTDPLIVYEAFQRMLTNGFADGIVGVRREKRTRQWKRDGEWIVPGAGDFFEDESVLIFRRMFIAERPADWRAAGSLLPYEIVPIHR